MKLLLLNAIKGLKKKKIQMFGIIFLVLLSTAVYTTMNSAIDRIEDRYYNYLEENRVEHFSAQPVIDYQKDVSLSTFQGLMEKNFVNATAEEKGLFTLYEACLAGESATCDQNTIRMIEQLFLKYDAYIEIANQKLDSIKDQYDFEYQLTRSKMYTEDGVIVSVMPYDPDQKINQPYLVDGKFPEKEGEITVLPKFAETNDLEIGDSYKIGDVSYKIVGFAYASDYIYPMLSMNQPIFNEAKNNIVLMKETSYEKFQGLKNDAYSILLHGNYDRSDRLVIQVGPSEEMQEKSKVTEKDYQKAKKDGDSMFVINYMLEKEQDKIAINMNSIVRILRTDMIQQEFASNRTFADAFLYLLLSISVCIIIVITKKRIDDERLQIGVLKSLGYQRFVIALSYLVYPIFGSVIGGVIGFLIGVLLHGPITSIFLSYYTVPLSGFQLNFVYLKNSIVIPVVVLSLLSYLIAITMLRKKPLELFKEGSNLKINWLSKLTTKLTKPLSFESRFRYQLASRSIGKLLIVTLTSFCTGLLIVLILIGMNLFDSMIDQSFDGLKYDYMVSYQKTQNNNDTENDLVLSSRATLKRVLDSHGKEKKLEDDDYTISLTGIDSYTKYLSVKDADDQNLIPKLYEEEHGIVINKNVSEYMKVNLKDQLVFDLNGVENCFTVVGIEETYLSGGGYVNRGELSTLLGYSEPVYSMKYTKDQKYRSMKNLETDELNEVSGIFSIQELRHNIERQMQRMNSVIYIIIGFASLMVFIIIAVIANIVVEENKKTISLMKVIGYKNKEISSIVLNIYTPFIIIAYLLSIPCMISILKGIVSLLVGDTKMVIPIAISPGVALMGLLGLLIGYYIAIMISKKMLNKVPLAVALKRE